MRAVLPLVALSAAHLAAAAPVISRLSAGGVGPNETLLIQGTGLAGGSARLCPIRGSGPCVDIPAAPSSWDGGLKATLPASPAFAAAFSVTVCSPGGGTCSDTTQVQRFSVNVPRINWIIGDGSKDGGVVAGGVVRAFGSALAFDAPGGRCAPATAPSDAVPPGALTPGWMPGLGALLARPAPNANTTALLCAAGGAPPCAPLTVLFASCFRVDASVPADFAPGAYTLVIDNGLASSLDGGGAPPPPLSVYVQPAWPPAVFTVGGSCGGVAPCLAAAAAAGGGLVSVPAGVWDIPANAALVLGSGVRLVGASGGASVLRWADNTAAGAPAVGLGCAGAAAVSNVTLLFTSPIAVGVARRRRVVPRCVHSFPSSSPRRSAWALEGAERAAPPTASTSPSTSRATFPSAPRLRRQAPLAGA